MDFKKTSESKGEKLNFEIKKGFIEIDGFKDEKHAYRTKFWFERKFPKEVIYGVVKKNV